ncbi:MAG: hypothetical protein Q8O55_00080 [Dehalococcoidales bacterium]|nr:hypothetical protein [Dehalococcoidales bacterium]
MDKVSEGQDLNSGHPHSLVFIREVVKYFMDFLETDFHKRRHPKRTVRFRSDNNLLVGIDLGKYAKFKKLVFGAINQGFHKSALGKIGRGIYQANIPRDLLQLIKIQSQRLTEQQVDKVLDAIAEGITKATSSNKEYDRAVTTALEFTQTTIKGELAHPFITYLEKPLKNLTLGDENTIYIMEDELTSIFSKAIEDKIANVVRLLMTGEKLDVRSELALLFNLEEVKTTLTSFLKVIKLKTYMLNSMKFIETKIYWINRILIYISTI